ncbi:hypothetical protein JRO89_XS12G0016400 [Xanthoceras sorbifolium]|uniref:Mediator complex subunit 4 n=1 Tax=Xanthoceras sorbifolium TaxID=99658 RepID=A0ABQ8HAF9_9ROSI|nr:hypothetical protein JRO89_XS12G0016400 [Xanthoceras sorbifolium]
MASSASKLFEVSPTRTLWLSAFRGILPTFLASQAQSQPPPPLESSPSSTKEIISSFTALQTQLFETIAEVQEILDLQDAKQKIALSYAHRISYTTFVPPEFGSGQGPLRGALPPAPQDEQLRTSQLYNFVDLDVGLPKTDEAKEKKIEAIIEPSPPKSVGANLSAIQGLLPPNITVPSGWKPGMPVELPKVSQL